MFRIFQNAGFEPARPFGPMDYQSTALPGSANPPLRNTQKLCQTTKIHLMAYCHDKIAGERNQASGEYTGTCLGRSVRLIKAQ